MISTLHGGIKEAVIDGQTGFLMAEGDIDAMVEFRLFSQMRELAKGKTTILISQRFSTVKMADRILVLEEGRLVESGTHEQLVAQGGLYATLYELQRSQLEI